MHSPCPETDLNYKQKGNNNKFTSMSQCQNYRLYKSGGKEPFCRILWLYGWHGVFNDQRYYFVQVHPSCNNHRSRGHFACLQTCFKNYKPGVMDISEWQAFGLLGWCRFFSGRKWKVVLILNKYLVYYCEWKPYVPNRVSDSRLVLARLFCCLGKQPGKSKCPTLLFFRIQGFLCSIPIR